MGAVRRLFREVTAAALDGASLAYLTLSGGVFSAGRLLARGLAFVADVARDLSFRIGARNASWADFMLTPVIFLPPLLALAMVWVVGWGRR